MASVKREIGRRGPEGDRSWGARVAALGHVASLLALVWRTHRGYAAAVAALRLARSLVPVGTLWVGKLVVDAVIAAARGGGTGPLWRYIAAEVALVVAGDLLGRASQLAESLLGDLFSINVSVRIMEHAATLDLEHFEDPVFYDRLERARVQTAGERIALLSQLLGMGQDVLTVGTLGAALLASGPWLALLLLVSVLPGFWGETHFAGLEYSLLFRLTPERRQLNYLRFLAASDRNAKEVKMLGLAPWLTDRYRALSRRFFAANRGLAARRSVAASLLALLGTAGYYAAYVLVVADAAQGRISIGRLTFLAGSLGRGRDLAQRLLLSASQVFEQSLYLRDLFLFFAERPRVTARPGAPAVPATFRRGFELHDVSFRYPGGERWALRNVSVSFEPGECVALVGENGAGKTTVTKLLARLYDPTEGSITLDGVDLRDYDPASLRRAIAVVFQDFVRFDLCFDENIGVGRIHGLGAYLDRASGVARGGVVDGADAPPSADALPLEIRTAAERSLADTIVPRLPAGYRQMLGRSFEGGVDLSGGEWQKVALARAYARMADARLLILDEPTAALDARAEYEVFERFRDLTAGRMSVLVSHRFSTARMADRVIVLSGGGVVEDGSHDELVALGGLYSELFELQSAGYR
jgi:ATP-binding cassette subfamily B protein